MFTALLASLVPSVSALEFPVDVQLFEAGAEPRRELRYASKGGSDYFLVLRIDSTTARKAVGTSFDFGELPDLRLRERVLTDAPTPSGLIRQHVEGFEYEYEPIDGTTAEELEALNGEFDELESVKLPFFYDDRGRLLLFELDSPDFWDEEFRLNFEETRRLLSTLAFPLPTEPVD